MHRSPIRLGPALLTGAMLVVLSGPTPVLADAASTGARVKMVDFAFRPKSLEIPKGTRVTWKNVGNDPHTSTSTGQGWDSGTMSPNDSFSRVLRKAGTFKYVCTLHPTMRGEVIVS